MESDRKAVLKCTDMPEEMVHQAIDCVDLVLKKIDNEKEIAAFIKKELDKKYNPTWHCVVERNLDCWITNQLKHFIYFYIGHMAVLILKS